jgi:hypothetical protein
VDVDARVRRNGEQGTTGRVTRPRPHTWSGDRTRQQDHSPPRERAMIMSAAAGRPATKITLDRL